MLCCTTAVAWSWSCSALTRWGQACCQSTLMCFGCAVLHQRFEKQ
jgi:hypothetical protein